MSSDALQLTALAVWIGVIAIGFGIRREIDGDWEGAFDVLPFFILWPLVIVAGAVVAAGWCLLWIPRGLVRLTIWAATRQSRPKLPRVKLPKATAQNRRRE